MAATIFYSGSGGKGVDFLLARKVSLDAAEGAISAIEATICKQYSDVDWDDAVDRLACLLEIEIMKLSPPGLVNEHGF